MNSQALTTLSSVMIVVIGATMCWALLSRVTLQARHEYEALLDMAAQPGASEGALLTAQKRLTALRLVVNGARYAIVLISGVLVLNQLDVRISGLLLPAGFLGAAMGVGAQNVVRDILAGLFFLFEAQFAVGDAVSINGVAGTVEEVGVRVTRLRDAGGQEHFFPNGSINTVARYPRRSVALLLRLPLLELRHHSDLEAAIQVSHQDFAALFDSSATKPQRLHPPGAFALEEEDEAGTPEEKANTSPRIEPQVLASAAEAPSLAKAAAPPTAAPPGESAALASKPVAFAWWRWEVHPASAALWREKFAPHVNAQLRRANLEALAGEAEVLNAPAEV